MRKKIGMICLTVCVITLALIIAGCATIFKGSSQEIRINSTPAQAKIVVKTTTGATFWEGATPANVLVSKKNEYMVTISLAGYKETTVGVTHDGIEGWFFGNLLCGGVLGMVIDLVDGTIYKLAPQEINVTLATARLQDNSDVLYAVFYALDSHGDLRSMAVPLQKDVR